jgi:hypothetical protein
MSNEVKLDLCTKIMILEAKRLPVKQFILLQSLYAAVDHAKQNNLIDYKDKGFLELSMSQSGFLEFSGLSYDNLCDILGNQKLMIWNTIKVKSSKECFITSLIPTISMFSQEDSIFVSLFYFKNITFKQAMFLSNKELEANKFLRRVYKRADSNNWTEYVLKNSYKLND